MKMNELVKFLVTPFLNELDEDTNLEYDGSVPAVVPASNIIRDENDLLKLKEFLLKNRKVINENLVTQLVDGGTNELSPFASVEGYYKYSIKRAENSGYTFLQDIFDPKFVYGNEKSGIAKKISNSELDKILEAYNKIDKLYLEYVLHINEKDNSVLGDDGSDYESTIDGLQPTNKLKRQTELPKQKAVGNGYNGDSSNTCLNYKHQYEKTPSGKHI